MTDPKIQEMEKMAAIQAAKVTCRKKMSEILAQMSLQECYRQSASIQEKLFQKPEWQNSKRISVYLSMEKEVHTDGIVRAALTNGKTCFIPICTSNKMSMLKLRDIHDLETLPRNSWGIREPKPVEGRENAIETGGVDLVVVPGMAFTVNGHRLGHGKGYYDKFFKELRDVLLASQKRLPVTVALAFKEQILPHVPTHDFDVIIDEVLTAD